MTYIPNIWLSIEHFWKTEWISNPLPEIIELKNKLGISKKIKFGIRYDEQDKLDAYASRLDNSIVVNPSLILKLNSDEMKGIIVHELHHLQSGFPLINMFFTILAVMLVAFSLVGIPSIMIKISAICVMFIFMIPTSWNEEINADLTGAKIIGKESYISALIKLHEGKDPEEASFSHPSLKKRIQKISEKK
jgi:Zn-dependent protease with chaperone function